MNQLHTTSTDRPIAELATAFYTAVLSGDADGVRAAATPDVRLHVPGTQPLAGTHVGPDAVLAFAAASRATTDTGERIEPIDLLTSDQYAALYCRVRAERGDRQLDNLTVHLARIDGGRIAEIWLHNFDGRHVDEFWS